jgi:RNA polymerase sigma-70 factor (ECF subfamily)
LTTPNEDVPFSEDSVDLHVLYGNVAHTEEFKLLTEMAIEGKSHLEMAKSRGISVDACKKRVQRAKETLQKKIRV